MRNPGRAILAGCCVACIAAAAIGCQRQGVIEEKHVGRSARPDIVSETDEEPQPQNDRGQPGDFLDRHSRRVAGPQGIDCGRVPIRGNPADATHCALKAQSARKPFRVSYDLQGIDSHVSVAMVRTPAGRVIAMTYDSDPSGGGRQRNGEIFLKPCPEPVHLEVNPAGRVDCFLKNGLPPPRKPADAMSAVAPQ